MSQLTRFTPTRTLLALDLPTKTKTCTDVNDAILAAIVYTIKREPSIWREKIGMLAEFFANLEPRCSSRGVVCVFRRGNKTVIVVYIVHNDALIRKEFIL